MKHSRRQRNAGIESKQDRLPPYSEESEKAILGCILTDPNVGMPEAMAMMRAGQETFYDLRHQSIYDVMVEMFTDREPIDVVTVGQRLKVYKKLDNVGGFAFLNEVADTGFSAANVPYYAKILVELHQTRKLIQTCTEIVGRAYEHEGDTGMLFDQVERDILSIRTNATAKNFTAMKQLIPPALQRIEDHLNSPQAVTGLGTGIEDLDKITGGLKNKDMIVIAARPSMGKTSLAMQIGEHVAIDLKLPVGVFSLEMSEESLTDRILCSRARVNARNIQQGYLAECDFPKITGSADKLSGAPIYIDDERGISIGVLRAKARRMQQAMGIKLFIIDYLQLLHAMVNDRKRFENRQQEIAEISSGIKSMAGELNVPVIVLSQLSRDLEKSKGRKPMLSDLRESGAIEQDADVVGMLYKVKDDDDEKDPNIIETNLLIAKQRNGPTGDVRMVFFKGFTRFESAAKISDEDVPQGQQEEML